MVHLAIDHGKKVSHAVALSDSGEVLFDAEVPSTFEGFASIKEALPEHVVPAGSWFGAQPRTGSEYSFVGCSVAPGFDFLDFEMGKKVDLVRSFSSAKKVIERFT